MTTREGLITSEFDDAALIDGSGALDDLDDRTVDDEWDDLDEDVDEDDMLDIDLELVVFALDGTTVTDVDGRVRPVLGVEPLIRDLRASGVKVALTTSFSREATDAVLDALGWRDLTDVALTPSEAGRALPFPDLPLTALLRTGASSVEGMVVVGDTVGDVASGVAAGAGLVVGVLSGSHDEEALLEAGADAVIPSIADLPSLLGFTDDGVSAVDASFAAAATIR